LPPGGGGRSLGAASRMRDELKRSLTVGTYTVADVIDLVEKELDRWQCDRYTHITRALSVSQLGVVNLETIFSKPVQEQPVPIAVVVVFFNFDTSTKKLTYQFEQESVLHTVGGQSLAPGRFQGWLDRIIGDKLQVRQLHDLATPFEKTRLVPPEVPSISTAAEDQSVEETQTSEDAPVPRHMSYAEVPEKLPLSTLLVNIFDAADEEDEFELTHKEVSDLLYATPLGLTDWDIKLLLTSATELETGRIEYRPFVQQAPEIIEALRRRRADFEVRRGADLRVGSDAIELCYGEEIAEVARAALEAFAVVDSGGKGTLSRHEFRQCLLSRAERFSMMEVQMLMQMCKEDDFGQVPYDEFAALLEQLRIDALHNALVETEIANLRVHLILLARRDRLSDTVVSIWDLRAILLNADQLCLSRMQIHVILMILHPDEYGFVDFEYFLRVCCTAIPQMFDIALFKEKAELIAKEKADALAKQEMEELQGITSTLATKKKTDEEDQEEMQANAPDRDQIEKALINLGHQADEKHRQNPALEVRKFLEAMRNVTELSEAELRGFISEAEIEPVSQEIAYVDHIKAWVPIIFELRKSRIYDGILNKDWGFDAPFLVSLVEYEADFPLRPPEPSHPMSRPESAASNRSSRSGRRPSSAHRSRNGNDSPTAGLVRRKNSIHGASSRPQSRNFRRVLSRSGSQRSIGSRRSVGSSNDLEEFGSRPGSRKTSRRPSLAGEHSRAPSRAL